jgi:hypothetical protein
MNPSNSNTSGAKVANVGFWPRGLIQYVAASITVLVQTFKRVLTGDLQLCAVDFVSQSGSDCLPDAVMEEIARRIIVTLEAASQGNVVFSATPPDDKSKVWWQLDPATLIPIGSPKLWNETTQAWEPITSTGQTYVPPRKRHGTIYAPAGASTVNFDFAELGTDDYSCTITPTTFLNGSWGVAPNNFPTHFGWVVVNKATNQLSIGFYGTPTGGLTFEIDLEERVSEV